MFEAGESQWVQGQQELQNKISSLYNTKEKSRNQGPLRNVKLVRILLLCIKLLVN